MQQKEISERGKGWVERSWDTKDCPISIDTNQAGMLTAMSKGLLWSIHESGGCTGKSKVKAMLSTPDIWLTTLYKYTNYFRKSVNKSLL